MKISPVKEHVQQVSTRICHTQKVKLDDPYKLLAMAIILQACLDCINYGGRKNFADFLNVYDQYSDALGLDILPEQFMESVLNSRYKWSDGRIQHTATAYMLRD